jgi:hypothetical protein
MPVAESHVAIPEKQENFAPQEQRSPGSQAQMTPRPVDEDPRYRSSGKLQDTVAIITGADSGIGRAVAIAFAKEGADIAALYLNEHDDAKTTERRIRELGRRCLLISGDVGNENFAREAVDRTLREFRKLDIIVTMPPNKGSLKGSTNLLKIAWSALSVPTSLATFFSPKRPSSIFGQAARSSIRHLSRLIVLNHN